MKVLICHNHRFELWRAPLWIRDRLAEDFPESTFVHESDNERLPDEIPDTDILVGSWITPEYFHTAHKLKWIHSPAAAVHQLMFPELVKSDVMVTNAGGVHGPVVAEHAIAVLLALAKRLPQAIQHQRRSEWAQTFLWRGHPRPREIFGATVAVIGMGSIGREFTIRAKALGMTVLAVRENPAKGANGADAVFGPSELCSILGKADYVLLCTPVTSATTSLIDRTALACMKPDAYLINVGRGPLIDEAALLDALQNERIAGAGLDVFNEEPLPPDSPLWSVENILITPHTAAATDHAWERHYRLIGENLRRFQQGRELLNSVDKRRGY